MAQKKEHTSIAYGVRVSCKLIMDTLWKECFLIILGFCVRYEALEKNRYNRKFKLRCAGRICYEWVDDFKLPAVVLVEKDLKILGRQARNYLR